MGKISDRIMGSVDGFAAKFGDRLAEWSGKVINTGAEKIVEKFEPEGVEASKGFLARMRDMPGVPQEIRDDIDKMINPKGLWGLIAAIVLAPLMIIPMVFALFQPLARLLNYAEERMFRSGRMDPTTVIRAYWRGHMTEERMRSTLVDHGLDETDIETLINVTKFYPAPADLVRWQAREVFEEGMVKRYGLDDELEGVSKEPFLKAGMTEEQIKNYWRAHWEHASWIQVVEMLRRGQLTEADVSDWFRLVEIPPFWRDKLIAISWNVPTRVDVRRFWDMRTIDEARLREIYTAQGYHGKDLDDYVLWTKVYTAYPDLIARWTKGWLTIDAVRAELTGLGMPADRVEEMLQTKIKATEQEPITEGKKVSQTAIIKWVKEDIEARWEQGVELLMDLDYDEAGARFVLDAYIADMGSPETFEDWKKITSEYRRATGREAKEMPEELKAAADQVVKLTEEVEDLGKSIEAEKRLIVDEAIVPEAARERLTELEVTRNRAIAELERVRSEYNQLLAEWKHQA